jgi:hypothetical protein
MLILAKVTLLWNYCILQTILQKCNLSKDHHRLPEDDPDGPKHVGANAMDVLIVNFNILYVQ